MSILWIIAGAADTLPGHTQNKRLDITKTCRMLATFKLDRIIIFALHYSCRLISYHLQISQYRYTHIDIPKANNMPYQDVVFIIADQTRGLKLKITIDDFVLNSDGKFRSISKDKMSKK